LELNKKAVSRALQVSSAPSHPLRYGRGESRQIVGSDATPSGLTINVVDIGGNTAPGPYHLHQRAATCYLVQEGRVRFIVDGKVIDAEEGEGCFMDPGVPHAAHNVDATTARVLLVFDASTEGDFIEVPLEDHNVFSVPWKGEAGGSRRPHKD
jgi:quercetin dioxygenase-like cupin family protein